MLGNLGSDDMVFATKYFDFAVHLKIFIIKYCRGWAKGNMFHNYF